MNKINILFLSFLTIVFSSVNAMESRHRSAQSVIENALLAKVVDSFKSTKAIKLLFLRLEDFDENITEDDKILTITNVLKSYQVAHKKFIYSKCACDPQNLPPKYLLKYEFCNPSIQDEFQAKANELLGGYVLDLHQWLEEMRSVEYDAFLIPYKLVNG